MSQTFFSVQEAFLFLKAGVSKLALVALSENCAEAAYATWWIRWSWMLIAIVAMVVAGPGPAAFVYSMSETQSIALTEISRFTTNLGEMWAAEHSNLLNATRASVLEGLEPNMSAYSISLPWLLGRIPLAINSYSDGNAVASPLLFGYKMTMPGVDHSLWALFLIGCVVLVIQRFLAWKLALSTIRGAFQDRVWADFHWVQKLIGWIFFCVYSCLLEAFGWLVFLALDASFGVCRFLYTYPTLSLAVVSSLATAYIVSSWYASTEFSITPPTQTYAGSGTHLGTKQNPVEIKRPFQKLFRTLGSIGSFVRNAGERTKSAHGRALPFYNMVTPYNARNTDAPRVTVVREAYVPGSELSYDRNWACWSICAHKGNGVYAPVGTLSGEITASGKQVFTTAAHVFTGTALADTSRPHLRVDGRLPVCLRDSGSDVYTTRTFRVAVVDFDADQIGLENIGDASWFAGHTFWKASALPPDATGMGHLVGFHGTDRVHATTAGRVCFRPPPVRDNATTNNPGHYLTSTGGCSGASIANNRTERSFGKHIGAIRGTTVKSINIWSPWSASMQKWLEISSDSIVESVSDPVPNDVGDRVQEAYVDASEFLDEYAESLATATDVARSASPPLGSGVTDVPAHTGPTTDGGYQLPPGARSQIINRCVDGSRVMDIETWDETSQSWRVVRRFDIPSGEWIEKERLDTQLGKSSSPPHAHVLVADSGSSPSGDVSAQRAAHGTQSTSVARPGGVLPSGTSAAPTTITSGPGATTLVVHATDSGAGTGLVDADGTGPRVTSHQERVGESAATVEQSAERVGGGKVGKNGRKKVPHVGPYPTKPDGQLDFDSFDDAQLKQYDLEQLREAERIRLLKKYKKDAPAPTLVPTAPTSAAAPIVSATIPLPLPTDNAPQQLVQALGQLVAEFRDVKSALAPIAEIQKFAKSFKQQVNAGEKTAAKLRWEELEKKFAAGQCSDEEKMELGAIRARENKRRGRWGPKAVTPGGATGTSGSTA